MLPMKRGRGVALLLHIVLTAPHALSICVLLTHLLWTPAQRKRAMMLYFANVLFIYFFMAALFSGPG